MYVRLSGEIINKRMVPSQRKSFASLACKVGISALPSYIQQIKTN